MENNLLAIENFFSEKSYDLYMTFNLSGKSYAILAERIIEIVQLPALYVLEKVPEYIVGLMNLRGKIISVIDLRKFLGVPVTGYSTEHQVLILKSNNKTVGIIVDSINDVVQLNRDDMEPLPYNSNEGFIRGLYKVTESVVAFIDLDIIINNIETVHHDDADFQAPMNISANLFPTDPISQEKFNKRALNLQKEIKLDVSRNDYQEDRFVSFCLNNEIYCISLKFVREFCKLKLINLTTIPCVPEFIVGLINLRGEFITIIDIKSFLQIPKSKITEKTKIIVAKSPNLQIGLLVDDVFDIVNIPLEQLRHETSAKYKKPDLHQQKLFLKMGL